MACKKAAEGLELSATFMVKTKSTNRLNGNGDDAWASEQSKPKKTIATLSPPDMRYATFTIKGTAPLVICRMSEKVKAKLGENGAQGGKAHTRKDRSARDPESIFNAARYISADGWDGFKASCIRNAMISACRLVDYKMTLAKMSIFVVAEGFDKDEPQTPLIRIRDAKATMQEDVFRNQRTGSSGITYRPAYHGWRAKVRIRWDNDQFTFQDISNLLMRVGMQVGIGVGRPDSTNSAGMDWGTFELELDVERTAK